MVRCWQDSLNENDRLKADLARLSRVHQQLRENLKILPRWRMQGIPGFWMKASEVDAQLALAASTTETPTP